MPPPPNQPLQFSSDGFDLDALSNSNNNNTKDASAGTDDHHEDVILELGGAVTHAVRIRDDDDKKDIDHTNKNNNNKNDAATAKADALKQEGNQAFVQKDWARAYDLYTDAMAATPGQTGAELIQAQRDWVAAEAVRRREELARSRTPSGSDATTAPDEPPRDFVPPPHPHGDTLAVYHSNRAAACLQLALEENAAETTADAASLDRYNNNDNNKDKDDMDQPPPPVNVHLQRAIQDCTIALLLKPTFAKALVRRSTAHERAGDTEAALADAKSALTHETTLSSLPASMRPTLRATVARLQAVEDARLERLKTETLDKLKDLGNSILGNFGLSMDNFNAQKDPQTGSYSISFNQGA